MFARTMKFEKKGVQWFAALHLCSSKTNLKKGRVGEAGWFESLLDVYTSILPSMLKSTGRRNECVLTAGDPKQEGQILRGKI